MPKNTSQNIDTSNFIPSFFLIAYLCLGFIPNWEAVDKIAPQWLLMSILNTASLGYILYFRNQFSIRITHTLSSALSYTYIGFIGWAALSYFYAINTTEVLVNITRQVNVLMMFLVMGVFIYNFKEKKTLVSYVIAAILSIEVYAVHTEARFMINTNGFISIVVASILLNTLTNFTEISLSSINCLEVIFNFFSKKDGKVILSKSLK